MTPIKITAHLYNGFSSGDEWSPSIDSILAYWQFYEQLGSEGFVASQSRDDRMVPASDLPLEKIIDGDHWWYACSSPMCKVAVYHRRYMHRRFDQAQAEIYLSDGVKKVQTKAGAYKNSRMVAMQKVTRNVVWHVIGNHAEIQRLLSKCHAIGAKTGAGLGRVREWSFAEGDPDLARHARPLPMRYAQSCGLEGDVMQWGIHPPGRLASAQALCVMPRLLS